MSAEREAFEAWFDGFRHGWKTERDVAWDAFQAGRAAIEATKAAPAEPVAQDWRGAEEWMPLAWELCAEECGEEACTQLVWQGGPVPEPWGDRWLKYEGEAKRLIALVRKCLAAAPAAAAPAVTIKLGTYGSAFDQPGDRRAYTYKHQPGNTVAWALGEAATRVKAGGDLIDCGLCLLQQLEAVGFGVFELSTGKGGEA